MLKLYKKIGLYIFWKSMFRNIHHQNLRKPISNYVPIDGAFELIKRTLNECKIFRKIFHFGKFSD